MVESDNQEEIIMSTNKEDHAKYYLKGNPVTMLCTNVLEIMGGRTSIWKNKNSETGIEDKEGNRINRKVFADSKASFSDKKLEFATFPSIFHMSLGKSKRVYQDQGPFIFRFNTDSKLYKKFTL